MPDNLSQLKIVRVGYNIGWDGLKRIGDIVLEAFKGIIRKYELQEHRVPEGIDEIETSLLTKILNEQIGGHILGVTNMALTYKEKESMHKYLFGGKDSKNDVAVVSTRRLFPDEQDPLHNQLLMNRTSKVVLHEEGHNFGLPDHYKFQKARDGTYCPMIRGDYNRFGEFGYIRAVIDARGLMFCEPCIEFLYARPRFN